ncbi:AAA family ATPase (plasmid) [Streptomyces finlayi]|uniref:AAA family ATPase n=1 Tax=Streptomyces finlayi TaxID=67296 RepID=A0A7G7BW68_9ACTN|nr:LuxR family transcriptional regulator [Streptomyces finlayi]QNE79583.1 AAA family ATPase [Streptomyces finlayi]
MVQELFGRSEEFKIITEMLDSAVAGAGAVSLMEGMIGTGKTALLRWAEATARDKGMVVLSATASPVEQHFSLGIVHQLLATLPQTAQGWERALATSTKSDGGRTGHDYPLLAELCAGVGRAARCSPILLTVDSLQHADRESLLWLGFLSRRLANLPVVLLATKRCGETASDQHLLVEFMEGIRPDRHIHLRDLSPSAASDLAAALCGHDHESVDALVAGAGGNPYLLTEQMRNVPAEQIRTTSAGPGARPHDGPGHAADEISAEQPPAGPQDERVHLQGVKERILCMLRRLDPHCLKIARAASTLGSPLDPAILSDLCGVPTEEACRSLSRLTESGLLCRHDMKFRHPLLSELLYQDIPCAERAELHLLAARFMRRRGAPPADVSAHLLRSHRLDEPWMVRLLLDAAQGMVGRDPARARRLIEKAVLHGVPDELAVRAEGMRIQALTALDLPASARALTAHAAGPLRPEERLREALRLSDILLRLDELSGAREVLEKARAELGSADPSSAARLRRRLTHVRLHEGTYRADDRCGGEDRLERVLLLRTATGDSARAARRIANRSLTVPRAPYGSSTWYHALLALLWSGDVDEARRHLDTEVRLARAQGAVTRIAEALVVRALVQLHRGLLADAEDDACQSLELLTRIRASRHHVGALARSVLIDVALEKDDIAAASALLDEAPPLAGEQPRTWWRLYLLHSAGRALGRLGQVPRGLALIAQCEEELARRGIVNPAVLPWRSTRSGLLLAQRNVVAARRAAREETELARRWNAPFALGRALVAEAAASSGSEALHLTGQALDILEPSPTPLLFAHALYEAGRAHRQAGKARRTRELLHRANEMAISLGADGLVEAVQWELRYAGGRPDPRKDSAESLLTPTERQVSELAARGMSNRDIARLLKVSLRNIESHLTHSYRKLRISRRHELAKYFPPEEEPAAPPVLLRQIRTALTPPHQLRTG